MYQKFCYVNLYWDSIRIYFLQAFWKNVVDVLLISGENWIACKTPIYIISVKLLFIVYLTIHIFISIIRKLFILSPSVSSASWLVNFLQATNENNLHMGNSQGRHQKHWHSHFPERKLLSGRGGGLSPYPPILVFFKPWQSPTSTSLNCRESVKFLFKFLGSKDLQEPESISRTSSAIPRLYCLHRSCTTDNYPDSH